MTPEKLPRRAAHAAHALLVAAQHHRMPCRLDEVVHYDEEVYSRSQTLAGLQHAKRRGYAWTNAGLWIPTPQAYAAQTALEDRYLRETAYLTGHPAPEE